MAETHSLPWDQNPSHRAGVGAMGGDHVPIGKFNVCQKTLVALDQHPLLKGLELEQRSS